MRYNRQIILPEVGEKGQEKLGQAKVLIIGAGGLTAAILPYLAAAGIGEIGIIDDDSIEISNLQRQVIYKSNAVGKSKALEAKEMALSLNPSIQINAITDTLNAKNAIPLFEQYDIMVDATDNLHTKYLINDACQINRFFTVLFINSKGRFQFLIIKTDLRIAVSFQMNHPIVKIV